jgi:hypothetical protein
VQDAESEEKQDGKSAGYYTVVPHFVSWLAQSKPLQNSLLQAFGVC